MRSVFTNRRLQAALRGALVVEASLLGWLGWSWTQAGADPAAVVAILLGLALAWRLAIGLAGFLLKALLGDWGAGLRHPLRSLWVAMHEALVMLRLYLWDMPFAARPGWWREAGEGIPLLLVHGFLCNAGVWNSLLRRYRTGRRPVLVLSLGPTYLDFAGQLEALAAAVAEARTRTGEDRVLLVGHSMGGLLARAYAEARPWEVGGLVSIAAPHHGTRLGGLLLGPERGPPTPSSRWLREFNTHSKERLPVAAVNFWTADDQIVIPARSSLLSAVGSVELPALGHLACIVAPRATDTIVRAIESLDAQDRGEEA